MDITTLKTDEQKELVKKALCKLIDDLPEGTSLTDIESLLVEAEEVSIIRESTDEFQSIRYEELE